MLKAVAVLLPASSAEDTPAPTQSWLPVGSAAGFTRPILGGVVLPAPYELMRPGFYYRYVVLMG